MAGPLLLALLDLEKLNADEMKFQLHECLLETNGIPSRGVVPFDPSQLAVALTAASQVPPPHFPKFWCPAKLDSAKDVT